MSISVLNTDIQDDVLNIINHCISCLKKGGKTEDILFEMLKSFEADDAVFLSSNSDFNGINLAKSYVLCKDRKYLNQYADYYWQQDPLYQMQFCPDHNTPVFKTDDVIPYSQLISLEYYNSFLRPQNLLGELIIRLYSDDRVFGAISLQRNKDHPNFGKQDIQKASILVPFLINIFECANQFVKINAERILLERWMETHSEGVILLDSELRLIFSNLKARLICLQIEGIGEKVLVENSNTTIPIPQVIIQDCINLSGSKQAGNPHNHSNRIINLPNKMRYYVQYFYLSLNQSEQNTSHFIIFLNKLAADFDNELEFFSGQHKLSRREEIIAQYAAEGLTNKQIADKLRISPFTVQNHLKNIFTKTGLDSRTKLANLMKY